MRNGRQCWRASEPDAVFCVNHLRKLHTERWQNLRELVCVYCAGVKPIEFLSHPWVPLGSAVAACELCIVVLDDNRTRMTPEQVASVTECRKLLHHLFAPLLLAERQALLARPDMSQLDGSLLRYVEQRHNAAASSVEDLRRYVTALRNGGPRFVPAATRKAVIERDGGRCRVCGSSEDPQVDHIIPVSRGGPSTLWNLRVLCRGHNLAKSARLDSEWLTGVAS